MSAQLENADMQFQEIKNEAETFQYEIVQKSKESGEFRAEKLNIDTLQALLEFYFPEYEKNSKMDIELLDDIIKNNFGVLVLKAFGNILIFLGACLMIFKINKKVMILSIIGTISSAVGL